MKEGEGGLNNKRFTVLDFGECHSLMWECKGGVDFVGKIMSSE